MLTEVHHKLEGRLQPHGRLERKVLEPLQDEKEVMDLLFKRYGREIFANM